MSLGVLVEINYEEVDSAIESILRSSNATQRRGAYPRPQVSLLKVITKKSAVPSSPFWGAGAAASPRSNPRSAPRFS